MNYTQAVEWVHSLGRLAPAAGLARMRKLLKLLGNPQQSLAYVHVAGTNGKGSVVTMLASILAKAGYRVGANISPYVLNFRERFMVNGQMITEEEFAAVAARVKGAAEAMEQPILEFEAVTAAAFLYFKQQNCQIVCLETGLGGRMDSTNIVENTLVACIARIGLDHMELLGDTIEQIAAEKCGIMKPGCTVVSYPAQQPAAARQIQEAARQMGCPLVVPAAEELQELPGGPFQNNVRYKSLQLQIPFAGYHQALNAMVVAEAAFALNQKGFSVSNEAIEKGIRAARFPARIEIISTNPLVILDGAHNADSAEVLAGTLAAQGVWGLTVVMGVLKDKQPLEMLRLLAAHIARLYTVQPNHPRALAAGELAKMARPLVPQVAVESSLAEALADVKQKGVGKGLLVCGSLYLASEARPLLQKLFAQQP